MCRVLETMTGELEEGGVEELLGSLSVQPSIYDEIREAQSKDEKLEKIREKIQDG